MDKKHADIEKLEGLVERLRGENGCPWDREQTRETLKPMLIEESYEVLDALDSEDPVELKEELGDLLFQVVFTHRFPKNEENSAWPMFPPDRARWSPPGRVTSRCRLSAPPWWWTGCRSLIRTRCKKR